MNQPKIIFQTFGPMANKLDLPAFTELPHKLEF